MSRYVGVRRGWRRAVWRLCFCVWREARSATQARVRLSLSPSPQCHLPLQPSTLLLLPSLPPPSLSAVSCHSPLAIGDLDLDRRPSSRVYRQRKRFMDKGACACSYSRRPKPKAPVASVSGQCQCQCGCGHCQCRCGVCGCGCSCCGGLQTRRTERGLERQTVAPRCARPERGRGQAREMEMQICKWK